MARGSQPSSEDTPRVTRSLVLCNFQITRLKKDRDENGRIVAGTTSVTIKGNEELFYPKKMIEFFNLALFEGEIAEQEDAGVINIDGFTYTKGSNDPFSDGGERIVIVPSHTRQKGNNKRKGGKRSALVPTGFKTVKDNPKFVSILFPSFFTNLMVSQMLGSMIKERTAGRQPAYWVNPLTRSRNQVLYNSLTAPFTNATCGAWVGTEYIVPSNIDNVDNVSEGKTVGTGGDPDGPAEEG